MKNIDYLYGFVALVAFMALAYIGYQSISANATEILSDKFCDDTDGGVNMDTNGKCVDSSGIARHDGCVGNTDYLKEWYCDANDRCIETTPALYCGEGKKCTGGACVAA